MNLLVALAPWTLQSAAMETSGYSWDWSRNHRFYLESRVQLPTVMWLGQRANHEARITAFDLRLVTTCTNAQIETRRTVEVSCLLDDVALSAAGLDQERGLLQPILQELDDMLGEAVVQLQMNDEGRIVNIDLEGLDRRNSRAGWINENVRMVLTRAFAGLDLALPPNDERSWVEYESWLMRAPAVGGSSGSAEVVHKEVGREAQIASFISGGHGVIIVGDGMHQNKFDTRMTGETRFDLHTGRISDRTWSIVGGPTASSSIAFGAKGYPYMQEGRVVALTEGEPWDVGESLELHEVGLAPTAIQQDGSAFGGPR